MIVHASAIAGRELSADVVIVGAGPAGLAVASRLARSGRSVLVLDSGDYEPAPPWELGCARSGGRLPYFDLAECRPRGLGGSTTLWGGWCEPFDDLDFEARPLHGATGWCVSRRELEPYYEEARWFCGIPETVSSRDWALSGELRSGGWPFEIRTFPVLGPRQLGHAHADLFDGAVQLVLGATVKRVVTTTDGTAVDHLEVAATSGDLTVSGDRFVLAAGGIETPRLLLCSTSKAWPTGIGNGHDLVGRCFMEHPHVDALRLHGDPLAFDVEFFLERSVDIPTLDGRPMATAGCLVLSGEACRAEAVGRVQLFIEPAGGHREHPLPRTWRDKPLRFKPSAPGASDDLAVIIATEQVPNRHSRVVLSEDLDRHGMPLPRLEWKLADVDHRTALAGTEAMRDLLVNLGATKVTRRLRRDRWPLDTLGGPHHLGTVRMARSAADGVVDERCRVHGTQNLFVTGGAVFPTSGHAPPTLTIVALALRLGEHLAEETRRTPG